METGHELIKAITTKTVKPSLETLILGKNMPTNPIENKLIDYIMNATAAEIWRTRNREFFQRNNKGTTFTNVKKNTRERMTRDIKIKHQDRDKIWRYKNVLCEKTNEKYTIKI